MTPFRNFELFGSSLFQGEACFAFMMCFTFHFVQNAEQPWSWIKDELFIVKSGVNFYVNLLSQKCAHLLKKLHCEYLYETLAFFKTIN